ncbi:MAG TPA: RecQ family ATP-dependent DNA helicase [Candidatus Eisenbacteria bacterium]|nr:RecQ family ATP-dependent DNA helicase [Candidatus Eisenbacteria bacterium]
MLQSPEAEIVQPHEMIDEVRRVARERFGLSRLHREQERAILSVLGGRDTLLILPTGGGKSLCYQLPSVLLPRPTVVVSPLLALLEDQHQKLVEYGIPAIRLDSTVGVTERREALARLKDGGSLLVLTTPETLAGNELGSLLEQNPPGLVAVDEAHCISEWGHDFRPAYLALGQRVAKLQAGHVLALTATATQPVRDDIIRYLGLRDPEVIVASPHRHNLVFEVRHVRGDEKLRQLAKLARRLPRPGIIYCSTTKAVEDVWLGLRLIKIPTARYHGKMTDKDRTEHQARFMHKGKRIVMVATSAFGLGIDKPDIRYIVHYQAPASLERYLQEAGRAGRDGHQARCILLFDESDLAIQEHLLALSRLSPALLGKFGRAIAAYAGEDRDANIEELALSAGISQRAATSIVTALVEAGIAERVGDRVRALGELDTLVERVESLRSRFEVLRREDDRRLRAISEYANETGCRSQMLRRYFGDVDPRPCGRCDLCRANGLAEPGRGRRRRRRGRGGDRHPAPVGGQPSGSPEQPLAAQGRRPESHHDFPDPRRRRRRRRGRRGAGDGAAQPQVAKPVAPPLMVLEPLGADADELAAELGAPGLPPLAGSDVPPPIPGQQPGHHPGGGRRRRRRRRRRGHGQHPAAAATPAQT